MIILLAMAILLGIVFTPFISSYDDEEFEDAMREQERLRDAVE